MNKLTLASLFDGSGGFPLAGILSGIRPVWASEIEPFPVRVTTKRMPFIKHYGDVSKINGAKVEPVDIITFGSPCQDMSVAGRRAGLDGSRSNLFYEAVRIIKEMRCATDGRYPRYIVWENVPGAFSSNKGEDFRCVLESICRIKDETVSVPGYKKWNGAGHIVGRDYSVAWRVIDAQYWGVPQRRKRIYLVADFAGFGASEILFESEGLSRYSAESFNAWKRTARDSENGARTAGGFDGYNGELTGDVSSTLGINCGMSTGRNGTVPAAVMSGTEDSVAVDNHPADGRAKIEENGKSPTLTERMGTGGNNVPLVMKIRSGCEGGGKGPLIQTDKSATLSCNNDQTLFEPCSWDGEQVSPTLTKQNAGGSQRMPDKENFNCVLQPVTGPLLASGYEKLGTQEASNGMYVVQPFGISSKDSNAMKSANPHSGIYEADTSRTVDTSGGNPSCNQGGIAVVCVDMGGGKSSCGVSGEKTPTLACTHGGEPAVCIQGSMIGRADENGPQGSGLNEDISFTLNATDRHAVYSMTTGSFPNVAEEKTPPLLARDFKDATVITDPSYGIGRDAFNQGVNAAYKPAIEKELQPTLVAKGPGAVAQDTSGYSVRRLTPVECARLQGFPDRWCAELGTEEPSSDDLRFWYDVFETHRKVCGTGEKPKTLKQIIRWLKDPYSDSAEYKMWGNGIALPCAWFVLSGIVYHAEKTTVENVQ